ncbi:MAG TPA: hypothetical protein V6D08_02945 [Candidatus Obscuribacterales bacterium]
MRVKSMRVDATSETMAPSVGTISCTVGELSRDMKRMLRVQWKEFIYFLDEKRDRAILPQMETAYVPFKSRKPSRRCG